MGNLEQNIEIMIDKDYSNFNKDICSTCIHGFHCKTEDLLFHARWNQGFDFPTDKIHRKGDRWICDDYEPMLKDSFKINEDIMKQPVKGRWFKHK